LTRLLFIGDIFASPGRNMVAAHLPRLIQQHKIHLVIANGENSAGGFGITPPIAQDLYSWGVDVITSGNHIWDKREIYDYLPREARLLRPANYPQELPGHGVYVAKARNGASVAVLNLQGRVHLPSIDDPFRKADELLAALDPGVKLRFVDFHAELTSEKQAMGWHLNGRVTAMVGTHTHTPTADERILSGGTAYQTDAGMTGPYEGVIGSDSQLALKRFQTGMPIRLEAARAGAELRGCVIDADEATGKALSIRRVHIVESGPGSPVPLPPLN
jgi:2',3'-cyclic-nucleotide 2'-phosphodiesterase